MLEQCRLNESIQLPFQVEIVRLEIAWDLRIGSHITMNHTQKSNNLF